MPTDPMQAIATRDPSAAFLYGVRTTGIFCRPACPSPRPAPANVVLFPDAAAARAAGFRACRRCGPDGLTLDAQQGVLVAAACRTIEAAASAGTTPSVEDLAVGAGLSRFHFQRLFRSVTGVTPGRYGSAARAHCLAAALDAGAPVTAAAVEAGYGSTARLAGERRLGMTPSARRRRGAGLVLHHATAPSAVGLVLVAATDRGVAAVLLGEDPAVLEAELRMRFPAAAVAPAPEAFVATVTAVVAFLEAPAPRFGLPLDIVGTAFQEAVWHALTHIPPGVVRSYADVARALGRPRSARAVAAAVAANPLAVVVPCHRVIASDGRLSDYAWGRARKAALLAREGVATTPDGGQGM